MDCRRTAEELPKECRRHSLTHSTVALRESISSCRECLRCPVVCGEGPEGAAVMIIGEAPGQEEVEQGRPFVGDLSSAKLQKLLEQLGVKREAVYVTYAVKCFSAHSITKQDIMRCRLWLRSEIALVGPKRIVAMGKVALLMLGDKANLRKNLAREMQAKQVLAAHEKAMEATR